MPPPSAVASRSRNGHPVSVDGRWAMAVEARLALLPDTDPGAPGGAITVALCGHWEHEGSCRWPHHTRIDTTTVPATLRTVVVVDEATRDEVAARIEAALTADERWSVRSYQVGDVGPGDGRLARRLLTQA